MAGSRLQEDGERGGNRAPAGGFYRGRQSLTNASLKRFDAPQRRRGRSCGTNGRSMLGVGVSTLCEEDDFEIHPLEVN